MGPAWARVYVQLVLTQGEMPHMYSCSPSVSHDNRIRPVF